MTKGGDLEELRTDMKFVQSINEAVEDVEDRLELQKRTSKELLNVVDKLEKEQTEAKKPAKKQEEEVEQVKPTKKAKVVEKETTEEEEPPKKAAKPASKIVHHKKNSQNDKLKKMESDFDKKL